MKEFRFNKARMQGISTIVEAYLESGAIMICTTAKEVAAARKRYPKYADQIQEAQKPRPSRFIIGKGE